MVANRRVTGGDAGDGSEQTPHVVIGYVDARAGRAAPGIAFGPPPRDSARLQSCPSGAGTTGPFGMNDLSATDAALPRCQGWWRECW